VKERETFEWGSKGKFHNEDWRFIKLKDMSDSHLLHVIAWIEKYPKHYGKNMLDIMQQEQRYRVDNYIFIPDYTEEIWDSYLEIKNGITE
jgi:hypothetical protein